MRAPKNWRCGRDNGLVVIELDGQAFALTPDGARQIAKALMVSAAKADEFANANNVIKDQALLIRAGVPIALSRNPKILQEAKREAETDRDLRRYMPMVPSSLTIGSPTIIQHAPKSGQE